MCGIAGQIRFDGRGVERGLLEKMGNLMEHRGRDSSGVHISGNVGLAHRRLSIIDLSDAGQQPMLDGDIGIVFNGEIFNFIELRRELKKSGYIFNTNTDTEVIIKCYKAYGIEFLEKIEGMFAFALLDKMKKKLYLVRDRMGIKPLYYNQSAAAFTFASEIKAIVKTGVCPVKIDPVGLCDYIHIQLYTRDRTLFEDIKQINPGEYLSIDLRDGSLSKFTYWDIQENETSLSYDDAISQLRYLIDDAIRIWSRADVPIAAYISGGLDSSSVATIAKKYLNTGIQSNLITFSSIFPETNFKDERPYSDAVADRIQSEHHRIILPRSEMAKAHEDLLYVLDMPIAGYASPYKVFSRIVRKHAKVVLTGHGGDECFCGYPKYIAATIAKQMTESLNGGRAHIDSKYLRYIKGFESQAKQIIGNSMFSDESQIISSLFFRSAHLWKYVNPDIRRLVADYSVSDSLQSLVDGRKTGFLKKLLYLDFKVLLPGLLHVEDRTSMIENLESRTPLLDRRIVEFAGSVPEEYLLKDGLKGMIRKAMEPLLPEKVITNPSKSGTLYPIAEMIDVELKELLTNDLKVLDESGLFIKPAREMLSEGKELINKRITWALWSLGSWIKFFKPEL